MFDRSKKTPAAARYDDARQEVAAAVFRIVKDGYGAEGFERRDLYPGASTRFPGTTTPELWFGNHPKPFPHLEAAAAVRAAAREEERKAIDNARGQGLTWPEIADALGLTEAVKREHRDADEGELAREMELAGWRYAAMGVRPGDPDPESAWRGYGRGPTANWSCWTCHGKVHEGHPDNGPVDAQEGHKPGCARYADLVAERDARFDDA